ncbi:MAG: response regulator [Subdoligranulum sp.]|nr:response regulator [Subdoligranulum sp.]MCI7541536.1 response regulator [Subdoligranulum sp.]MDD7266137.1 response regulator [Subdoligranulum sp.]
MERKITILSIDDEENIRFALGELFRFQGWEACCAPTVEKGIEQFRLHRPDIVLIDYHMPGINGVEGVRLLRKLSRTVPIIVFTIDESQEVADQFLQAGASDFALKPIKAPDIISRIKLHLRLLEREQPAQPLSKGLSEATLQLVLDSLKEGEDYMTVNEVAKSSGLAYQTVYRYLQYLIQNKKVEMVSIYGKVGRPRQLFRRTPGN